MSYVINDALDDLLDLIARLLWPSGMPAEGDPMPPQSKFIEVARSLKVNLSDEQIEALKVRAAMRQLSVSRKTIKPRLPQLAVASLIKLDNMRADGLLGRLVAQYWAFARARAWYQVRCGSLSWDDDSPGWRDRNKPFISKDEYKEKLKDSNWYGVGLEDRNYTDRYSKTSSSSTKYRRRYSLESTFSNWSAPPWFRWYSESFFGEKAGHPVYSSFGRWGGKLKKTWDQTWVEGQKEPPVLWFPAGPTSPQKSFLDGSASFGDLTSIVQDSTLYHGFREYVEGWDTKGSFSDVGTGQRVWFHGVPWRNSPGTLVSKADRRAASYKIRPVLGTLKRTQENINRYYTSGYYLVRTALDILLARGESPADHPGFVEHCEWWFIACPTVSALKRLPDLSAIGAGVVGMSDVKSSEIVRYVMQICPKPGTVPPWEDRGPLWTWPVTTGHMQCLDVPLQLKPREDDDSWGNIVQYILSVEVSICANMASGVVNTAIDAVVDKALEIASEWIAQGVSKVLGMLESEIGKAAFDAVKEVVQDVSSFAGNIARFADAEKLVGEIAEAANLPKSLSDYLGAAADGVTGQALDSAKDIAQSQIDSLRRQWDYADDLIGSVASMGRGVQSKIDSFIP